MRQQMRRRAMMRLERPRPAWVCSSLDRRRISGNPVGYLHGLSPPAFPKVVSMCGLWPVERNLARRRLTKREIVWEVQQAELMGPRAPVRRWSLER